VVNEVEQKLIDNIVVGIGIFIYENQKLKLVGVNKKLEDLFGINRLKLKNTTTIATTPFLHPDDKKIIENFLKNIKKNNENINFSARYYNYINNKYSYFHVKTNIIRLENNSLKIYLTYSENSFNSSNLDKYKIDTLNKLGIILWKYNPKEKRIYDYINFMGYSSNLLNENKEIENIPESLIEKNIIHPDDVFKYRQLYKDIDNGKFKTSCKIRIFFESIKEYMWVKIVYTVINNPFEIIGTMKNITEEKKTDSILKFVVKNEFDYLARADYKKNEYIVYFSNSKTFKTFEQKAILTLDEFRKLVSSDIIASNSSFNPEKITLKTIFKSLKKTGYFRKYYKIIDENKNKKIKEIKISNINLKNGIFYIVRRDVTDLYRKNEKKNTALREALKLAENANKSKTMFLATMSHDIKTPMNAIIGMTELSYGLIKKNNTQLKKNLDIIRDSSKTLMTIINEVLDMNRISNGRIKFAAEKFKMSELPKSIIESFEFMIQSKKQKVYVHLNIIHDFLIGDVKNIRKVSYSLLENSIKYTPTEGQIDIYIDEITHNKNKDKFASFLVKIKDNGIGIGKEDQKKIFEPFHRGSNVGNEQGTGLGLPIVKGILDLRGSNLKVESELGKGTTFTIEISFKIDTEHMNDLKKIHLYNLKNDLNFKNKKVLLVEDNEINRLIARKNLENYHLIVEEAVNGEDGYNKFINSPKNYYSLIFMDLRMPFLDGFCCTKKIRNSNHPDSKAVKIIALTANTFTKDRSLCFEAGMDDYIAKPINVLYLKEILEKYIEI